MIKLRSQTANSSRVDYYAIILSNFKKERRWIYLPSNNTPLETDADNYGHVNTIYIYTYTV